VSFSLNNLGCALKSAMRRVLIHEGRRSSRGRGRSYHQGSEGMPGLPSFWRRETAEKKRKKEGEEKGGDDVTFARHIDGEAIFFFGRPSFVPTVPVVPAGGDRGGERERKKKSEWME